MRQSLRRSSTDDETSHVSSAGAPPDNVGWSIASPTVPATEPAYSIGSIGAYPTIMRQEEDAGVPDDSDATVQDAGPGGESLPGGVAEPAPPYEPPTRPR
jgi:hypothetical protein